MTETVTITGTDLHVTHDQDERPDPKRIRPARFAPSVVSTEFRTIGDVIAGPNPYWSAEANADAESSDLPPKDLARMWAAHRIEPKELSDAA